MENRPVHLIGVALAMMVLTPAQQPIVPNDCRPRAAERSPASRSGSTNFYDQARDSIAVLYPGHRLLAERRAGTLGNVEYSLIAYQPVASPVSIAALAVDGQPRAWSVDASCAEEAWADGLIAVMRAVAALPGQPTMSSDAPLIEAVRATVAREIDLALPVISFDAWLVRILGPSSRMQWEVNDCGEQTGNPALDRGREFPQCVQVRAALAGNRALILMLSAGSRQQRTAKPPGYHTGVVVQPDGALVFLKSLGEAAAAIRFP